MTVVRVLVDGSVTARALRIVEPLSFWGGVDPTTGRIIEKRHPQHGDSVAGKIVSMPTGRGSSSASSILAEALRLGCGPVGFVLESADGILVAGALVARELYDVQCPIVVSDVVIRTGEIWSIDGAELVRAQS